MKAIEKEYFTGRDVTKSLPTMEDWKIELINFIKKASSEGKWIRSFYQDVRFTPKGLAGCLINGRFVWGIVNFELIEPRGRIDYGDSYYEKIISQAQSPHPHPPATRSSKPSQ